MASPLVGGGPPGPPDGPTGPTDLTAAGAPPMGGAGGAPGLGGQPGQDPAQSMGRAIVTMSAEVDRVLMALAEVMPSSGPEISQARKLIEQGVAKFLAQSMNAAPTASPTETGSQFPGGGFSSGRPT